MRPCRRVFQVSSRDLDVDVGVIYTHERGLMDRLLQYVDQALPGDAASIVRRTWTEITGDLPAGGP